MGVERALSVPLQIKACHYVDHDQFAKAHGYCLCGHLGHKIQRTKGSERVNTLRFDPENELAYTYNFLKVECECGQDLAVYPVEIEVATCK